MTWLYRRWWLVLVLAAIGGIASLWFSRLAEPVHRATTTLIVGDLQGSRTSKGQLGAKVFIASAYADLIRSPDVLEPVISELSLPWTTAELKDRVYVDLGMQETPIIGVEVFASSPEEAVAIARSIDDHATALGSSDPIASGGGPVVASATRIDELEREIARQEARLARLEGAILGTRDRRARARLRSRYELQSRLLMEMDTNYLSTLHPPAPEPSGSLRVLQPAIAETSRLRPNTQVNTALGVGIGALIGIGIAYGTAAWFRRRIERAGRHAPVRPVDIDDQSGRPGWRGRPVDPWIAELGDP